jgi:uncharacterized delta-60 repeat protein
LGVYSGGYKVNTYLGVNFPFNNSIFFYSLKETPNGNLLVGGNFTEYKGKSFNKIIRLKNNGSIDTSFNIGTGFNNDTNAIALQTDGKILVGGGFTTYKDISYNRIIRLNSDGTIDTSFNIGDGFNNITDPIIIDTTNNKILVGGGFTEYSGSSCNRIIRLNSDGTIDNTFNISTGFDSSVYTIALQPNEKILVGGAFTEYSGSSYNCIIRLNSDGTIDNTFNIGTGFNGSVYTIALQPNEKILVGGGFTEYSGSSCNRIIRLNSDGTIDNTFNIGTGFDNYINAIVLQTDKILVGGAFTEYNENSRNYLVRLNSNGTIDNTFNIGTGFDNYTNVITLQTDGKILVGGDFTEYNGNLRNYLVRLNSDGTIDNSSLFFDVVPPSNITSSYNKLKELTVSSSLITNVPTYNFLMPPLNTFNIFENTTNSNFISPIPIVYNNANEAMFIDSVASSNISYKVKDFTNTNDFQLIFSLTSFTKKIKLLYL